MSNLGDYEKKVLSTLVFEGRLDAGTLSDKSEVPQSKVYDVLGKLQNSGLAHCENDAARPKIFVAVHPEIIIDTLTRPYHEMMKNHNSVGAELTEFYEAALQGAREDDPSEYASLQTSRGGIKSEVFKSLQGAMSIISIGKDFSWLTESKTIMDAVLDIAKRGGEVRLLSNEQVETTSLKKLAKNFRDGHVEIRIGGRHQGRGIVVNKKIVLLGIRRRNPKATEEKFVLVKITSPEFAKDLLQGFSDNWNDAEKLEV